MKLSADPIVTACAIAGGVACLGDVIIPAVLGRMVPGYDSTRDVLSRLGCADSPVRWWINGWWCVFGVLIAAFAFGVFRVFASRELLSWPGLMAVLLLLFGLGAGPGAGLFPMDVAGTPRTLAGALHDWLSGAGFAMLFIVPAIGAVMFSGGNAPAMFWLSVALQCGGIACAALIGIAERPSATGILAWSGFWQRAFLLNYYVYLLALAATMLAVTASARSSPP